MTDFAEILANADPAIRRRAAAALAMMNDQAIGCEAFRIEARAIVKQDSSPVTIADLLHQAQLQQMLAECFPADGLIAEEPRDLQEQTIAEAVAVSRRHYPAPIRPLAVQRPQSGEFVWMFDPIDGTKGYLAGRHYAIALGLFRRGEPVFAAMAAPANPADAPLRVNGSLAFAAPRLGAWIGRIHRGGAESFDRLRPPPPVPPYKVSVSVEHDPAMRDRVQQAADLERVSLDSQIKYLAVAAGDLAAYVRNRRKDGQPDRMWDHMPGAIIAEEAGCAARQFDGSPFDLRADSVIRFEGGLICCHGAPGGPVWLAMAALTRP
ncbi:MAG: 3'(2'),5'-bisphosphate nucleotidase CysQ [candidate division BRC1 bacterium ADurb.BinA364]|nr:MAG: 3'(2'),5'-bisphosphate nucleotidase CysQ [candidate division BRC1 bacterium ADurb.BinA364]